MLYNKKRITTPSRRIFRRSTQVLRSKKTAFLTTRSSK